MKSLFVITILCAAVFANAEICHFELAGDVDGNCKADLVDLGLMAQVWLTGADIADLTLLAQSWLINCNNTPDDPECTPLDIDGDGFDVIADCNDNDPTIYPGATEILGDGIDQNCDGSDAIALAWVSIDDPGIGDGHEGFNGEMSKYETTNAQYCQFLNDALASGDIYVSSNRVYGSDGSNLGADFVDEVYFDTYAAESHSQITYSEGVFSVRIRDGYDMSNHPVILVNWNGATAFCSYYGFRLPTEWEWQAVADYDGSYTYGCGTTIDYTKANYNRSNPLNLNYPFTSPVDYYPSYGYGMNDMAGNAWEWTSTVSGSYRVIRGGGWYINASYCTVSNRVTFYPLRIENYMGFRVCR